jgi:hypothetical protein
MIDREPRLFKGLDEYVRQRQVMASAVVFKAYGWHGWQIGHAKLYGILLWHYETKKQTSFKYSKILKKLGYRRTHNYRLLKGIVENNLLVKKGNGRYCFTFSGMSVIKKILRVIKELDMIKSEAEVMQKSVNTVSSEKTTNKNAKQKTAT